MTKKSYFILTSLLLTVYGSNAWACGGFFCNANQPVNQAAERIVFARADGKINMHVQIQYQGPPTDFGWILPTAPDVETAISSEALFSALDRIYGPRFNLNTTGNCPIPPSLDFESTSADPQAEADGGVQVLSREAVGPYDRAIIQAQSVDDLRAWLDEQQFAIPESIDEKLSPYIQLGSAFVVIKLLAGNDASDLVPLRLTFSGDRPAIPILPTGVAAEPDMGIIVHVMDQARAIPVNYRHVIINEAAIDWLGGGQNYADVVSQAADEAGGRAFVTDFAGAIDSQLRNSLEAPTEAALTAIAESTRLTDILNQLPDRTNPDFIRIISSLVTPPDGVSASDFLSCPRCFDVEDPTIDGAQVAARLREEVVAAYEHINALTMQANYLTRLYSTMSPEEMEVDPIFSINVDLEDVSNFHSASNELTCDDDGNQISQEIILADGRRIPVEQLDPIIRQEGETVRGTMTAAAASIEQMMEAGQPEVLEERTPEEMMPGMMTPDMNPNMNSDMNPNMNAMDMPSTGGETPPVPTAGDMGGQEQPNGAIEKESGGCQQQGIQGTPWIFMVLLSAYVVRRKSHSIAA